MNLKQIKETLNDNQYKAVTLNNDTNALILAGAGSGKTRILTHRIAYLCSEYMLNNHQILAVTFTNKAASEMKHRLQSLLNKPVGAMWIGTFHGLAYRMLQENTINNKFQIIDAQDQLRIIKGILKVLSLDEKKFVPQKIRHFINKQKDEGNRSDNIDAGYNFFNQKSLEVYKKYQKHCDDNQLLDFGEILLKSYEMLKNNDDIKSNYQEQFQHILIDEFQDTNKIQYNWIKLLKNNNKLFLVGDDDQSIYGWRGAKIANIHNAQNDFKPMEFIRLEQNYRSTGHILAAANALISNNKERLGKTLWTQAADGELIEVFQADTDKQEIATVVGRISDYLENSISAGDCAILYRTNAQSRLIEENLITKNIPYEVYGGLRFFERAEIKHIISYLKLAINHDDDVAFVRVVNFPPRGIGASSLEKLTTYAQNSGLSLFLASSKIDILSTRAKNSLLSFRQLIINMADGIQNLDFEHTIEHITDKSSLITHYSKSNNEVDKGKIQNIEELAGAAREYQKEYEDSDDNDGDVITHFIANTALDSTKDQKQRKPSVQLTTIHSAKGLEFPYVFIVGLEEEIFPSSQSQDDEKLMSEERRLCYVAMTRAMKKLHLSFCKHRFLWGKSTVLMPSRFLLELPKKNIKLIKIVDDYTQKSNDYKQTHNTAKIPDNNAKYTIGDRVAHEKFGVGSVLNYEGNGSNERIEINFKKHGKKWIILAYAKIIKL